MRDSSQIIIFIGGNIMSKEERIKKVKEGREILNELNKELETMWSKLCKSSEEIEEYNKSEGYDPMLMEVLKFEFYSNLTTYNKLKLKQNECERLQDLLEKIVEES